MVLLRNSPLPLWSVINVNLMDITQKEEKQRVNKMYY